jgi:hypothetical protein
LSFGSHQRQLHCLGLRGDKHVIAAYRSTVGFQNNANCSVHLVHTGLERRDLEKSQDKLNPLCQPLRRTLGGSETQLSGDNNTGANRVFTDGFDSLCNNALRISDEVGKDVRVE